MDQTKALASTRKAREWCNRALPYLKPSLPTGSGDTPLDWTNSPVWVPYAPGLLRAYLVDEGDKFLMVQNRHVTDAAYSDADLRAIALANLKDLFDQASVRDCGDFFSVSLDGNFEASFIMLTDLWESIESQLTPNGVVVAVPSRDTLLFCDAKNEPGRAKIKRFADGVFADGDHFLIPNLLQRDEDSWKVVSAP